MLRRRCPRTHRAIHIVSGRVAHQRAGIGAPVVRNGGSAILAYDIDVEVHHSLSRNRWGYRPHAVRRMTRRATESVLRGMQVVLRKTGVGEDLCEIVALRTHGEGSRDAGVGIGKKIRHRSAGNGRLAELIVPLKNVRIDGTMRAIGSGAAELAVVVAVMAVGTEQLRADRTRRCQPLFIQHVR